MQKTQKFDRYLIDFQDDLKKIISANRYNHHLSSVDEILSEVNLYLIKTKNDIIEKLGDNFSRENFGRMAYTYARNHIVWNHSRKRNSKYVSRRNDLVYHTEDGPKTSFEFATEFEGEEDEGFESFDSLQDFSYILKNIREYSGLLNARQLILLRLIEAGLNQRQIAKHFGVTHQAISLDVIRVIDKIKCASFNFDLNNSDHSELISKGKDSISNFFNNIPKGRIFEKEDETELSTFLISNPNKYTCHEVREKLFDNKYSYACMGSMCRHLGVSHLLKKPDPAFTEEETEEFIRLLNKGASYKTISKRLNKNIRSLHAKFGHLKKEGRVEKYKYKSPAQKKYEKQREAAYKFIKDGHTTKEIAYEVGLSTKVISGFRIALNRAKKESQ